MRNSGNVIKSSRQLELQILLGGLPVLAFFTQPSKICMCPFFFVFASDLKPDVNFSISIRDGQEAVDFGPREVIIKLF